MKKLIITIGIMLLVMAGAFAYFIQWGSASTLSDKFYHYVQEYGPSYDLPTDTLSVMTYNIGYMSGMTNNRPVERTYTLFDANLEKAVALIDKYHPNFVGFQEIDFASKRSYYQNQLDSIGLRCEYPWALRSVNWDKRYVPFPYWPIRHQFGNIISGQAVATDFPFLEVQAIVLSKPELPFYYEPFYIERMVQVTDIDLGDTMIKLLNVHLEAYDKETRIQQAQRVINFYNVYADRFPILLIGDFNSEPPGTSDGPDAMDIIMKGKHIASAIDLKNYADDRMAFNTFSSTNPHKMIDYVLYNTNFITRVNAMVLKEAEEISDHLPVYFKFYIHGQIPFYKPLR